MLMMLWFVCESGSVIYGLSFSTLAEPFLHFWCIRFTCKYPQLHFASVSFPPFISQAQWRKFKGNFIYSMSHTLFKT